MKLLSSRLNTLKTFALVCALGILICFCSACNSQNTSHLIGIHDTTNLFNLYKQRMSQDSGREGLYVPLHTEPSDLLVAPFAQRLQDGRFLCMSAHVFYDNNTSEKRTLLGLISTRTFTRDDKNIIRISNQSYNTIAVVYEHTKDDYLLKNYYRTPIQKEEVSSETWSNVPDVARAGNPALQQAQQAIQSDKHILLELDYQNFQALSAQLSQQGIQHARIEIDGKLENLNDYIVCMQNQLNGIDTQLNDVNNTH